MQTAYYNPGDDIARFQIRSDPVDRHEEQPWGVVYYYSGGDGEIVRVEVQNAAAVLPEGLLDALTPQHLFQPRAEDGDARPQGRFHVV